MTIIECAAIKRVISIMHSSDKTEFINRLKTPDLTHWNGLIFSRRDQIEMPLDEMLIEKAASQQQTLAVAEGPLQNVTITCKCHETLYGGGDPQRSHGGIWGKRTPSKGLWQIINLSFDMPMLMMITPPILDDNPPQHNSAFAPFHYRKQTGSVK